MTVFLGIDIGTSVIKAVAVGDDGEILGVGRHAYTPSRYSDGRVEHDPEDYWGGACVAARDALAAAARAVKRGGSDEAPGAGLRLAAIGLTGMAPSTVFVGENGEPLAPSPIWQDMRARDEVARFCAAVTPEFVRRTTGMIPSPSFSGPKLKWMARNAAHICDRTRVILDAKDFVAMRMCGAVATDDTSAASSLLFDLGRREWSGPLIDALGVDGGKLPPVAKSLTVVGVTNSHFAGEVAHGDSFAGGDSATGRLNLQGVPVVIGAGDSLATAFLFDSRGRGEKDQPALEISGTSTCLMRQTPSPVLDPAGRLMCFPAADGHSYCIEAAIHTTGACLDWISRVLGMELEDGSGAAAVGPGAGPGPAPGRGRVDWSKVERIPAGADGLVFLPYIGPGERSPIWDDSARGVFVGITSMHSPEHMIRAVMEGVAFALRQNLDAIEELSGPCGIIESVGGPSANHVWQQIKADVLRRPVATLAAREATGCAAAAMAAAGIGRPDAVDAIRSANTERAAVFGPIRANAAMYDALYEVFVRSYQRLKDEFATIAQLLRGHGA